MRCLLLAFVCTLTACSPSQEQPAGKTVDPSPEDLGLIKVVPATLVPGTTIRVLGSNFGPENIGNAKLTLRGDFAGTKSEIHLPASYLSNDALEVSWPGAVESGLPAADGTFTGEVLVTIDQDDDRKHRSPALKNVRFDMVTTLEPTLSTVEQGVIFVNHPIRVQGSNFLFGGDEGNTVAVLEGCFQPEGETTCHSVGAEPIAASPITVGDRSTLTFPFAPGIAGINPGTFQGTLELHNRHTGGKETETEALPVAFDMVSTTIFDLDPPAASLGQYVNIQGGGFVGVLIGEANPGLALTTLTLEGMFVHDESNETIDVNVTLVPEFVSGELVRYVLSEQDNLGKSIDLRKTSGTFTGHIKPTIQYQTQTAEGASHATSFRIGHVKQVVWVKFLAAYLGSLRHFGLRAVDQLIRDRVFEVAARDYRGTNVEFRQKEPKDFALYARVELGGPDPNGFGLLGYDNTPGKDVDNARLYDQIGGVNATTQEDGYPGYGGVFVESFFGFSEHPGNFAKSLEGADGFFDAIFDPFRPDVGGRAVDASDLASLDIPILTSGDACPTPDDRGMQIACAVWVLGSMIGSTMTHEVAHSLGLSDPSGNEFHNPGDGHNRLMDSGHYRPFLERAEIVGQGPSVFCTEDYAYLQQVLPSDEADPVSERPDCW